MNLTRRRRMSRSCGDVQAQNHMRLTLNMHDMLRAWNQRVSWNVLDWMLGYARRIGMVSPHCHKKHSGLTAMCALLICLH